MNDSESTEPQSVPTRQLEREHRIIERVLAVLEVLVERARRGRGFERDAFGRAVEFFRLFADACHHAKEEDLLFPVFEARGIPREDGPIGVMLEEHRLARRYTREMGDALADLDRGSGRAPERFLDTADEYRSLLENHIFKEDNVLFRMGDEAMTSSDLRVLSRKFCDVDCRAFDGQTREQLESIAEELEAEWRPARP